MHNFWLHNCISYQPFTKHVPSLQVNTLIYSQTKNSNNTRFKKKISLILSKELTCHKQQTVGLPLGYRTLPLGMQKFKIN